MGTDGTIPQQNFTHHHTRDPVMESLAAFFTETYGWPPHIARMEAQHIAQGHPSWPPDRKAAILADFHAWQARH